MASQRPKQPKQREEERTYGRRSFTQKKPSLFLSSETSMFFVWR